ncbi:MAG: hypothetical protein QOE45_308 [Frankiaceae bacterium]|jgi:DNA-binding MarR family transcriptional regulator/GNAT superfamily N-acetyltransferase|nr:hypothetical protein [Frankiaceae bacterium]
MDLADQVRAFNRFYTSAIGVLAPDYLNTRWTVTEARVLFEVATRRETTVVELRRSLRLDRGHLSRVLARLENAGVVARERDPRDARRQVVRATGAGRRAFAVLDRRSANAVAALLAEHSRPEQEALLAAMGTIRRVLGEARDQPLTLAAPGPGDYGWVVERHGAVYAAEYGWDASFEALVARIVADYLADHDAEREAVWIAHAGAERVGSVFCVRKDDRTAQLRLLLVEPHARGLGAGSALVAACVAFARDRGYERLVLWTNDVLTGARRVYERAGFALAGEERHESFGASLVGQHWTLDLTTP